MQKESAGTLGQWMHCTRTPLRSKIRNRSLGDKGGAGKIGDATTLSSSLLREDRWGAATLCSITPPNTSYGYSWNSATGRGGDLLTFIFCGLSCGFSFRVTRGAGDSRVSPATSPCRRLWSTCVVFSLIPLGFRLPRGKSLLPQSL